MKTQIRTTTISLALLLFSFGTFAGLIKGKVKDPNTNAALRGVVVQVKSTKVKTKTDSLGMYDIEVPGENSILVFKHKNYENKEVLVGKRITINVSMVVKPIIAGSSTKKEAESTISYEIGLMDAITGSSQNMVVGESKAKPGHPNNKRKYNSGAGNYNVVSPHMTYDARVHNTEEYDVIRDNTFVSPFNEPLSTFSIDVDAASYSNVRRMISTGQIPYEDAVRIEEMINYFNYDYPNPTGEDPFSITTEVGPAPWNKKHQLVHIGLQGKQLDYDEVNPSNLVFLIDVSGSMGNQNKLPLLKSSMKLLINKLDPRDRVAIVVYAGAAGLVLPSTPISQKHKIIAALENLKSGGSTAGGQGIRLAYKVAKANLIEDGNNRIILATDGDFNVGVSSTSEMVRLIEEKRNDGIFLTITGFGMGNYKDGRMEQISNAGNGNYYYIDNIKEAQKVFVDEMRATLFTIAKDVKIQVEFNPAFVQSYRLIGYVNRKLAAEDFNDDKKDAGELGAGHTVTALYEIIPVGVKSSFGNDIDPLKYQNEKVVEKKTSGSDELLTVKFRYKEPDGNSSKLIVKSLGSDAMDDNTSENFRFSAAVAQFGML
ncbi:MAG: von Willebrand factor type A domain-containing protein, partial [Bacteroidetes bacterium]|nr:von Willebrand factor type A domain-containing protein [Bacteroidota bacterium]